VSKTLKPIIHHRDHERGGADVVLIAWEDCSDDSTEPPPITGGWKSVPVNITWTTYDASSPAVTLAGTFHAGTVAGVWTVGTGASTMGLAGISGSWLVAFSGTISRPPSGTAAQTEVWFEHDFDTGSRVAVYNDMLNPGDSIPIAYSVILTNPFEVSLPVAIHHFVGGAADLTTTLDGTMTFTWQ